MNLEYLAAKLNKKLRLRAVKNTAAGTGTHIASGCQIYDCSIGRYTAIAYDCQITCCEIGSFCSFASGIIIGGASHPIEFVSSSQCFLNNRGGVKTRFARHECSQFKKTVIGNDVWIGDRAIIKAGVTIADGAVIGMGSIVTKNVGPYEVWAGNPARFIKKRFSDEVIQRLLESKWWNSDEETLTKIAKNFNNIDVFLEESCKE